MSVNENFDVNKLELSTKKVLLSTIFASYFSIELFGHTKYTLTGYDVEEYLRKNYSPLLSLIVLALDKLKIFYNDPDRKLGLAYKLAIANTVIVNPVTFSQLIKIKIETDLPVALETGIISRINATFSSFYNIELSSSFSINDVDFCLSTHALSDHNNSSDILLISAQVTISDILAIWRKIKELSERKNRELLL